MMVSWTLFRRGQHATASHNAREAIGLAQAAGRKRDQLPMPMRTAIAQQAAQGYALDGDEKTSQRKLDEAHEWATTDTDGDARAGHGSFCTSSYIELQRAGCWLAFKQPKRAIRLYESTLPQLPVVYRRDRGTALGRLAAAYVEAREPEQAARVATEALSIAQSTGSTRTLNELTLVRAHLIADRNLPPVAEFFNELIINGLQDD